MKFVKAIVFMSMTASLAAHASAPSGGSVECPKIAAANADRAHDRSEDIKTAEMALAQTKGSATKTQSKQNGTARKGG